MQNVKAIILSRIPDILTHKIQSVGGLYGSSLSVFIQELFIESKKTIVFISSDFEKIQIIAEDLLHQLSDRVILFPRLESAPFEYTVAHPSKKSHYQESLIRLLDGNPSIVIVPIETLLLRTIPQEMLRKEMIRLKMNDEIERDFLVELFTELGYQRSDSVEEMGDFAVRGAIVDIFPFHSSSPVRIEFFGDQIISLREFDLISQLSSKNIHELILTPQIFHIHDAQTTTLFSYLEPHSILIPDEPLLLENFIHQWSNQVDALVEWEHHPYITFSDWENAVRSYHFLPLRNSSSDRGHYQFPFGSPPRFQGSLKLFLEYLKKKKIAGKLNQVFIYCENESRHENLLHIIENELGDDYLPVTIVDFLARGFSDNQSHMDFLTEHEIFNRIRRTNPFRKTISSGSILRKMNRLNPGELVVHVDYGIGIYEGVEKISIAGNPPKDVIRLTYRDGDTLYVSLDKISKVQKYTASSDNYVPELTKLGSGEWLRIRKKTRKDLEKVAADLIQIYALRMTQNGFSFSPDTIWQKEMESLFPYDETPDQLRCIEEIKRDMESSRPMDRLLCGDVGFGKTEVAIRAAFKAVQDSKQVAVLVPTTLLANQHFHTFQDRLKNFPVVVEMLSRFKTMAQQTEILKRLEQGSIDIIIGTHRLLSSDVRFKDLGLLIIDEEQRFGVKHKEKIRKFKATIDVLTMTATPIPRTLHMALTGARDLSQIETPPKNRLPIFTEITPWDDALIRRAILYEKKRGGQVFFVHNRIETIDGIHSRLKELVPEARFVVAHGQMPEHKLENIMEGFYQKEYDVLIATMIIENGIDIPNCNTIFINDAHRFGLAQLYQLRGRVGRSEQQAFAYLIVPGLHLLPKDSLKRLYALQEFTELGSGIKIALKDLEIRGAGNILGAQQSGHINAIGYDLFIKTLQETIEKMKESGMAGLSFEAGAKRIECTVDISAEIFLPDEYIGSQSEKAFLYYRVGLFTEFEELENFQSELIDRFGPLPDPAENFIFLHFLRIFGEKNLIERIQLTDKKFLFHFHPDYLNQKTAFDELVKKVTTSTEFQAQFKQDKTLKLILSISQGSFLNNKFAKAKKLLQDFMNVHYIEMPVIYDRREA